MSMRSDKDHRATLRGPATKLDLVVTQADPRREKAFLMVSAGPAAGIVFPVTQASLLIGRSLDADVRIDEPSISNEHALLEHTDLGYTLRDLASTNGTHLNGRLLTHTALLCGGDTIRMGTTMLTFITRESGLPRGTVRLRAAEDLRPRAGRAPRAERAPRQTPPPISEATGSVSLTDLVRKIQTCWYYAKRYGWVVVTGTCFGISAGLAQLWLRPPPGSAWFEMSLASAERGHHEESPTGFVGPEATFRSLPLIKETLVELGVSNVNDSIASDIQSALSFEPIAFDSKVYRGEYEDATAELAAKFLNQHLRVYIDSELDKILKVLRADAEFDREQEQQAYERVAEVRDNLIAFSDQHPEAVPKDAKLPEQDRSRLAPGASAERIEQSLVSARRALRVAYAQIQSKKAQPYLEKAASTENEIAEARARGLRDEHPQIKNLFSVQAAMREKAQALLTAEPSPSEQSLDPAIARLKDEIAQLEARLRQMPKPTRAAPTALAASISNALGVPRSSRPTPAAGAQSLAQLRLEYAELAREYERAKTEHEALMKKRETTDRQLERERTSAEGRYDIITPPTPEPASVMSAMIRRAGMGGMVGLGLALLAAACLELRRTLIARGHI